jgi:hypothetical protein
MASVLPHRMMGRGRVMVVSVRRAVLGSGPLAQSAVNMSNLIVLSRGRCTRVLL